MAGKNSQMIGSLGEKSTLASLIETLEVLKLTFTGDRVKIMESLEKEKHIANTSPDVNPRDMVFATQAGYSLGNQIAIDLADFLAQEGRSLNEYSFSFVDTSKEGTRKLNTDDIRVDIVDKEGKESQFPISLKTKSKSGHTIWGSASSSTGKFLERIFENTPAQKTFSDLIKLADDKEVRTQIRNIQREQKVTIDKASELYNKHKGYKGGSKGSKEDKNKEKTWKTDHLIALQTVFNTIIESKEMEPYKNTVGSNILDLAGLKKGTHLAMAIRKEGSPVTKLYTSFNCKKYSKIVDSNIKSLHINLDLDNPGRLKPKMILNEKLVLTINYIPSNVSFSFNPTMLF